MMRSGFPLVGEEGYCCRMRSGVVGLFVSEVVGEARKWRVEMLSRNQSSMPSRGLEMEGC
jgi:hypothetical protein